MCNIHFHYNRTMIPISFCSTDNNRLQLKVIGNQCVVHGSAALPKDQGVWDFYVLAGKDASQRKKHYQFYVSVNGKRPKLCAIIFAIIQDL